MYVTRIILLTTDLLFTSLIKLVSSACLLRKCSCLTFKTSRTIFVGWILFANMDRKPKQMLESWLQESSYSNVTNSFETLRLSIDEPFDIRGITKGSSSIARIYGNNIQVRKTVLQQTSNENRSHVLVSVLCNIEVARYMFTLKRIDRAIPQFKTFNRNCSLPESMNIQI